MRFYPVRWSFQSISSQPRNTADAYIPCPRIIYTSIFGTVPITASSTSATLKFCATSFHGKHKHDKYQKSATTPRYALIVSEVMIINHFCVLHAKLFIPLRAETSLKQCRSRGEMRGNWCGRASILAGKRSHAQHEAQDDEKNWWWTRS